MAKLAGLDGQTGQSESRHTKRVSVRRVVCVRVRVSMCEYVCVCAWHICTCIHLCVHTYVYGFLFCFVILQFPSEAPETCQATHYVCKCQCDFVFVCACEYVCVRVTYVHVRTYIYGFLSIFRYQAVSIGGSGDVSRHTLRTATRGRRSERLYWSCCSHWGTPPPLYNTYIYTHIYVYTYINVYKTTTLTHAPRGCRSERLYWTEDTALIVLPPPPLIHIYVHTYMFISIHTHTTL